MAGVGLEGGIGLEEMVISIDMILSPQLYLQQRLKNRRTTRENGLLAAFFVDDGGAKRGRGVER